MRFIDEVEISVASGKGGDGCVSFRREAHVPRGGPDGGDGGRGGSIIFEATRARNTLVDYRYRRNWRAEDGQAGMNKQMYGAAAEDLLLAVPLGTLVCDAQTGEHLADLQAQGERFEFTGGRGGRGNIWFKSSTRQTPMIAEPGKPGTERRIRLELKLIADVGLVGFPNAGKSTLISRISAARPKIADYPFTTLTPQLGVVSLALGESFVVADIPGLIEGAAEGRGLGHQFLRHVERCKLLLHLVAPDHPDGTPVDNLRVLQKELAEYDAELLTRPMRVVLTKIDIMTPEERVDALQALEAASGAPVFAISAVTGEGITGLVRAVWNTISVLQ